MAKKGPRQTSKKGLSQKQKEKLAEFCANFAVAWLAAGLIGPYFAKESLEIVLRSASTAILMAGFLLMLMLSLIKEKNELN
jgi:hypothetical protein